MRGASAMRRDRDGRRARSGGNSAINTNIFRSVLQPCFDNHPLQWSRVPSPSCDSYQADPSTNPPWNPSCSISSHPLTLFLPIRLPLASHPFDLKYVDTLAHIRVQVICERTRPHVHGTTVASRTLSPHLPSSESLHILLRSRPLFFCSL